MRDSGAAVLANVDVAVGLSERDRAILEFERSWWTAEASKEEEIQSRFNLTTARYYQILNHIIDQPAALDVDPLLVKRLRRLRSSRQRARSALRR